MSCLRKATIIKQIPGPYGRSWVQGLLIGQKQRLSVADIAMIKSFPALALATMVVERLHCKYNVHARVVKENFEFGKRIVIADP